MQISSQNLIRFFQFLGRVEEAAYPEEPAHIHTEVTQVALEHLTNFMPIGPGIRVLDVGCGQGPALQYFREHGADAIGISLNSTDVSVCQSKGFTVYSMDQSFMDFDDNSFDLVWARHVLEHSVMPLYTLMEYKRLLKDSGVLYIEVPDADTGALHASNKNHYSIFTQTSWLGLLDKAGLSCFDGREYSFKLESGAKDTYLGFYCRKKALDAY